MTMENNKFKAYGFLFLTLVCAFNLGLYAASEFHNIVKIQPHQWFLTIVAGFYFGVCAVENIRKL